ncbi:hypothetical protein [Rhodococcus koreensis]|uniref:hypothetical protein n=1 Tax=Rhodococcus koreensis TaxID=99653 RepID=UPI003671849D
MISPRPILMIVGEPAESRYYQRRDIREVRGAKGLFVVLGANHVDLYDQPQYMAVSMQKLDELFTRYLGA